MEAHIYTKSIPTPKEPIISKLKFKDYPEEINKKAAYEEHSKQKINDELGPKVEHHLVGPKLKATESFKNTMKNKVAKLEKKKAVR